MPEILAPLLVKGKPFSPASVAKTVRASCGDSYHLFPRYSQGVVGFGHGFTPSALSKKNTTLAPVSSTSPNLTACRYVGLFLASTFAAS